MNERELFDREGIRHTLAGYTMAGDRLDVERFVAVFTEDAVLETEGVPEADAFRHVGRGAIRDWINRWRDAPVQQGAAVHRASFVRHHLATSLIEFDDVTSARARTYWTAYTDIGPDHCGCYLDRFQKADERWLIAHRRIRLDWRSPQSLMFDAVANTRRAGAGDSDRDNARR